jgi:hypothetical protein
MDDHLRDEVLEDISEELQDGTNEVDLRIERVCEQVETSDFKEQKKNKRIRLVPFTATETDMTYLRRKLERSPIMPVLHHIQNIPLKFDLPIKVLIMELLHRQVCAFSLISSQRRVLQVDIMIKRSIRERNFLINPFTVFRDERPV